MAAACNVVQETEQAGEVNAELLEAHIVAQAITELQEIQAPATQSVSAGPEDVVLTGEIQTEGDVQGVPGQTHVIYYIEDGAIARTEDRTLVDSSVQANDYEIERRSGKLPARKRVIPVKFRDYKNNSNDEDSDSDYDPHEYLSSRTAKKIRIEKPEKSGPLENSIKTKADGIKRVGRPRKNFFPSHSGIAMLHDDVITNEVEKMYQEALQLTQNELSATEVEQAESGAAPEVEDSNGATLELGDKSGATPELGDSENSREEATSCDSKLDNTDVEDGTQEEHVKMEPVSEAGQSTTAGHSHRMTTRGKRVPVYGGDFVEEGVVLGRGRGRPRMSQLPFYKCAECGKTFKQKGNLKTHIRLHIAGTPYHCPEEGCDKTYRSNESLRRHLLTHQGIKPFQCDICEQRFSSNVALTEHRSRHLDERPYQCPHCQKCFRQVSCFRRHVVIHTGDLPHSCTVCHKRFAQTAYLKSHMKVHTGEKPYQCTVCFKRFAHQSDVKRHSTTHTGEKRYSCSKCQAKFSDVSSKNRHEREHENNKRYTCTLCNESFKRPGQLRSHLNKKHSLSFAVAIEKDSNVFSFKSLKVEEDADSSTNNLSQQRIVSLIKNLHSKAIPHEGIIENVQLNVPEIVGQHADIAISADNVTDISQLEKEVDASMIEGDIHVPIELEGVEIQEDGNGQTFIAITDLAESLGVSDKDIIGGQMRYKVLYEIDENGEEKQILVPFNSADEEGDIQLEYSTESTVPGCVSEVSAATETIIETVNTVREMPAQDGVGGEIAVHSEIFEENDVDQKDITINVIESAEHTEDVPSKDVDSKDVPVSVTSSIDHVNSPDFSKQEYYNWLTNFTEFCKVVPMPLNVTLFQKISQVHKTLSDVMATPCGVVADKENFRVLMNISKELSTIINEHLVYVLDNLNGEEKQYEDRIVAENE